MNVLKLLSAVALLLTAVSCSNEELDGLPQEEPKLETKSVANEVELSTVAQLLASIEIDKSVMDEVKVGVDRSLKYGLDEEYRFTDMLKPKSSKLYKLSNSSNLIEKMREEFNLSRSISKNANSSDFFDFLSDNDVQIYWPYSEDWDGESFPVITFNPENGNENWNYGYKRIIGEDGEIYVDTILVDEDYLMQHPVWIVNRNETKYADLPDFENGIYEKNGVLFDQPINYNSRNVLPPNMTWKPQTDPNLIYSFYIQNMRVYRQLDGVLAGGSEMVIKCAYPAIAGGMPSPVTVLRKSWTRKEIGNSRIKSFSTPLMTNWRQEQLQCGMKILEEDNGGDKNWEFSLNVNIQGKQYGVGAKIPFNNNDDEIVEIILDRNFINSKNNISAFNSNEWGIWRMYSEGGVAYSLPILTGN